MVNMKSAADFEIIKIRGAFCVWNINRFAR